MALKESSINLVGPIPLLRGNLMEENFLSGFAMLSSPGECGFIHAAPILQGLFTKRRLEDISSTGGLPWSGSHVPRKSGTSYWKQLCFQKVTCLRLLHARLGRSSSGFLEFPLSFLSNAQLFEGMESNKVEMTKKVNLTIYIAPD